MKKTIIYSVSFFVLGLLIGMGVMRSAQPAPTEEFSHERSARKATRKSARDLYSHMKSIRSRRAPEAPSETVEADSADAKGSQPGYIKDGEGIIITSDMWLQDLKADDPEAYATITNEMEQARQWQKRDTQKRCEFLESIDPQLIPEESRPQLASLISLIKEQQAQDDEIYSKLMTENAFNEKELEPQFERMYELHEKVREAYEKSRKILQGATVTALNLPDERFQAVIDTLKTIDEMTSEYPLPPTEEEQSQMQD